MASLNCHRSVEVTTPEEPRGNAKSDRETAPNGFRKRTREFSTTPFLLWHFSPGDKIENCSAQFLAVCWIAHVEFKVHRLRDRFSVRNALLLDQSLPAFIGHNLDQIGDGTLL